MALLRTTASSRIFTRSASKNTTGYIGSMRDGVTTADAQRIKDLERESRELRKANDILKLASAFLAQAELDLRIKS